MQRTVDNMPSQGGLDRDLGGLDVTNLTHENLVGVLAQNTAKAIGEGQPDLLLDLDLLPRYYLQLLLLPEGN